ncbi:hypothetical protein AOQ84DRAFT_393484 [Glonium stellatum]|uniref:Uncharacterized protein n=1 Tax=Glonium stellatum TaxID=574774 RepID=A0A8E2EMW4_9PEZI|nr:hypothetical protein AOQ84DRAFT_393484 [Glonium stellatum]
MARQSGTSHTDSLTRASHINKPQSDLPLSLIPPEFTEGLASSKNTIYAIRMTAPQSRDPLLPISSNLIGAKYAFITKVSTIDGIRAMDERAHDDGTYSSSSMSGLTSLEDGTDDFGKLMIRNARDERRLNETLRGNVQPFRKARPHPRVGLTMENLERNNGLNSPVPGAGGQGHFDSPGSENSSERSDLALRPPMEWGRKGRHRKDWLKRITSSDTTEPKPAEPEDDGSETIYPRQTLFTGDRSPRIRARTNSTADMALPSVDDRPLSRRSSNPGTPPPSRRRGTTLDRFQEWDMSEDFSAASLLASTPAIVSRNTLLDDIRQREIESVKDRAITTTRLDKIHETAPQETRRVRSSSRASLLSQNSQPNSAATTEQTTQAVKESEIKPPKLTRSIRSRGRSPATGDGEVIPNSPIVVYKSAETVGEVDPGIQANAETVPKRPDHRREDSHDLLKRLARVTSLSPSPARPSSSRPPSTTSLQRESVPPTNAEDKATVQDPISASHQEGTPPEVPEKNRRRSLQFKDIPKDAPKEAAKPELLQASSQEVRVGDVDFTPAPVDETLLSAKTPVVTGAWIDTPGPLTDRHAVFNALNSSPRGSESPTKQSPKKTSPQKKDLEQAVQVPQAPAERRESSLPTSALAAIVGEAKSTRRRKVKDEEYGDSTIESLEDIISPSIEPRTTTGLDEDTLQGLQLPVTAPRNQAERQRQQEIRTLHSMNTRLRTVRTSVIDAGRSLKRMEHQVNSVETGEELPRQRCKRCGCAAGHRPFSFSSLWSGFKGLFFDRNEPGRWGFTCLGLSLLIFFSWFFTETALCNAYCQPMYAQSMDGFGVDPDAPRLPFVTVTVLSRPLRWLWKPIVGSLVWAGKAIYQTFAVDEGVRSAGTRTAARFTTRIFSQATAEPDLSMLDDEYL